MYILASSFCHQQEGLEKLEQNSVETSNLEINVTSNQGGINFDDIPVAWLMSFPNSGTTYTNLLVRTVSGFNTATNYGNDYGSGTNVPIFGNMPDGPYYSGDPDKDETQYTIPTSGYLLSKTHCGSYCAYCLPKVYLSDANKFAMDCSKSTRAGHPNEQGQVQLVPGSYNNTIVKKAVHLIRDPLDNIVARFHHGRKKLDRQNLPQKYPLSKEGFREMCHDLDTQYYNATIASSAYKKVLDILDEIPCHAEFFRYIQWHNLAFMTTSVDALDLPTLILHYENYTYNYDETVELLHHFLGLERKYDPPLFVTGKVYKDYFEEGEFEAVMTMFRRLASNRTWEHMRHYFDRGYYEQRFIHH